MNHTGKGASVALAALLSAAAVGFFAGTRAEWPEKAGYGPQPPAPSAGVAARTYSELREQGLGPNTEIYLASKTALVSLLPSVTQEVPPRDPEARARALARREQRRAYDGAPPTIPHPTDPRALPNCLVCHEHGAKIAELIAPKMSHPPLAGCPQCHVESISPEVIAAGLAPALFANGFEPSGFGGPGARAWTGAPPVVPHQSFMRQRCDSCHGVSGALGLRTPHPDRQSCVQCHVFDEKLDRGSFFAALHSRGAMP